MERVDAATRLRTLLASAPMVHFAFDRAGVVQLFEGSGAPLQGRRPEELLGASVFDLFAAVPRLIGQVRRALAGEAFADEVELRGVWLSVHYVPMRDPAGQVEGVVGFSIDVSQQRRREAALAESEERYRQLAEAAFEAIAITEQGRIVDANASMAEMFGYAPSELIGASALDLCAPESRALVVQRLQEGYEGAYEAIGLRKDGSTFVGELRGKPVRYQGRPMRITAIRDLTDRAGLLAKEQAARTTAEEALRIRDEFISIASHELNAPLTSLRVRLQQLQRMARGNEPSDEPASATPGLATPGPPTPGPATPSSSAITPPFGIPWVDSPALPSPVDRQRLRELSDICLRQAGRLTYLVRQLLDVTRIRAGLFIVDHRPVDLCELVRDVVARMAADLERAECPFELRAPPTLVGAWDRDRLEQVVVNLLGNAAKYGQGQPITVTLDGDEAVAHLIVSDGGIGIPVDQQARVFDRFERGGADRQKFGGLGLGLYIVRRIVDAHGGTIAVHSEPGQGACFTVTLPRASPPPP
jgi:PAS domain S-box-containing protein